MSHKFPSSQYNILGSGSSQPLLLPNNILQPKRSNNSIDGSCRRILGSKGQISVSPNGISHLSNQQLTNILSRSTVGGPETCHPSLGSSVPSTPVASSIGNNVSKSTPSRKQPNTMAKRNARERNRVKQVNQGFQTLRQHIPETYRMKKMSKVDTLRCALDYIRNMERILQLPEMDSYGSPTHSSTNLSSSTSLIFSSEEEDLFIQSESPSYHDDHLNLLGPGVRTSESNDNISEESEDPVGSTSIQAHPLTFELAQQDNGIVDESEGPSHPNRIMICPPLPQNGVPAGRNDIGGVITAPTDLDPDTENNNRILIVTTNVDGVPEVMEMQVGHETEQCCNSSVQESHGHYSDGYSDIENLDHDDEHNKYHF